jgi:ABC-type xylose transport system permease subunit
MCWIDGWLVGWLVGWLFGWSITVRHLPSFITIVLVTTINLIVHHPGVHP